MSGRFYYWCLTCQVYTTSKTDHSKSGEVSGLKCSQCEGPTEHAVVVYPDKQGFPESMSHGQRLVSTFLNNLGLTVDVEAKIGKRYADVYLPEINTVVEYDGPTHVWASADAKRDEELKESGVNEILHIKDTSEVTLSWLRRRVEEISEGKSV